MREAGAGCLPSESNLGEGVRTVETVLFGGLLSMGGDSLLVPVWRSVGDKLSPKEGLDLLVAGTGT